MLNSGKYVIHEHLTPEGSVHWDLMFETGGDLETYRIPTKPELIAGKTYQIEKIFDHQLKFLDYEGPVNSGFGSVIRVDKGNFQLTSEDPLLIKFSGKILNCTLMIKHQTEKHYELSTVSDSFS